MGILRFCYGKRRINDMKNRIINRKVLRAMSIGLAAMMTLEPMMATAVYADDGDDGDDNEESNETSSSESSASSSSSSTESSAESASSACDNAVSSVSTAISTGDNNTSVVTGGALTADDADAADSSAATALGTFESAVYGTDSEGNYNTDTKAEVAADAAAGAVRDVIKYEQKLSEANGNLSEAVSSAQGAAKDINNAVMTGDEIVTRVNDEIKNATSIADAQKAHDEGAAAIDEAVVAIEGEGGFKAKYEVAKAEYDKALVAATEANNAYDAAVVEANSKLAAATQSVEDAKTALDTLKTAVEEAKKAVDGKTDDETSEAENTAIKKFNELMKQYKLAEEDLIAKEASLAKTQTILGEQLKALKEKADNLEKESVNLSARLESWAGITDTAQAVIAQMEKVRAESGSANFAELDKLFIRIMEDYYVPEVISGQLGEGEELVKVNNTGKWTKFDDDSRNYCTISYVIRKDGKEQTVTRYFNFKMGLDNKKAQDFIIFEKVDVNRYEGNNAAGTNVAFEKDSFEAAEKSGFNETGVSNDEVKDTANASYKIVKVGDEEFVMKASDFAESSFVELTGDDAAAVASDMSDANVGDSKVKYAVSDNGNLVKIVTTKSTEIVYNGPELNAADKSGTTWIESEEAANKRLEEIKSELGSYKDAEGDGLRVEKYTVSEQKYETKFQVYVDISDLFESKNANGWVNSSLNSDENRKIVAKKLGGSFHDITLSRVKADGGNDNNKVEKLVIKYNGWSSFTKIGDPFEEGTVIEDSTVYSKKADAIITAVKEILTKAVKGNGNVFDADEVEKLTSSNVESETLTYVKKYGDAKISNTWGIVGHYYEGTEQEKITVKSSTSKATALKLEKNVYEGNDNFLLLKNNNDASKILMFENSDKNFIDWMNGYSYKLKKLTPFATDVENQKAIKEKKAAYSKALGDIESAMNALNALSDKNKADDVLDNLKTSLDSLTEAVDKWNKVIDGTVGADGKLNEITKADELKKAFEKAEEDYKQGLIDLEELKKKLADIDLALEETIERLTPPAGGSTGGSGSSGSAGDVAPGVYYVAPAGPAAGVAGARVTLDNDSLGIGGQWDGTEEGVAGARVDQLKLGEVFTRERDKKAFGDASDADGSDIVTIADEEVAKAAVGLDDEANKKMNWWWLLLAAVLGITAEEAYRRSKEKKEAKAKAKADNIENK